MNKVFGFAILALAIGFSSCGKFDDDDVPTISASQQIRNYLAQKNLTADSLSSGLYYIIEEPGEGENPTVNNTVVANYKGYFLSDVVFDQSSPGSPIDIPLTRVITGWQQGIPLFKKGGKGKLFLPPNLAYGASGQGGIPPNTVIAFDVELIDFY